LPGQELTPAILAITNSLPKEADICLSQVREATYGFPSAIRVRNRFLPRVLSVDSLCAMGRRRRADDGGLIYYVLNRTNARMTIFEKEGDNEAFERRGAGEGSARHLCPG